MPGPTIADLINDTCRNAVVKLNVFNDEKTNICNATGFILNVTDGRIIVCTAAHNILVEPLKANSAFYTNIVATVTGAYDSDNVKNQTPIIVSLSLLGCDISSDVAILYSKNDGDGLSYRFGYKTRKLRWYKKRLTVGHKVYCLGNMYNYDISILVGNICDFIDYSAVSFNYTNNLPQCITNLPAKGGTSGAPLLVYDPISRKGRLCGIIQWSKIDNNYTGGIKFEVLYNICKKLLALNIRGNKIRKVTNFRGCNGKGYLGVSIYSYVDASELNRLINSFPMFRKCAYKNKSLGIIIKQISDGRDSITNSINITKSNYKGFNKKSTKISDEKISTGDIIREINGFAIKEESSYLSDFDYFNKGVTIFIECLRPCSGKILYFKCNIPRFPNRLEFVSTDSSSELLSITKWTITTRQCIFNTMPYNIYTFKGVITVYLRYFIAENGSLQKYCIYDYGTEILFSTDNKEYYTFQGMECIYNDIRYSNLTPPGCGIFYYIFQDILNSNYGNGNKDGTFFYSLSDTDDIC